MHAKQNRILPVFLLSVRRLPKIPSRALVIKFGASGAPQLRLSCRCACLVSVLAAAHFLHLWGQRVFVALVAELGPSLGLMLRLSCQRVLCATLVRLSFIFEVGVFLLRRTYRLAHLALPVVPLSSMGSPSLHGVEYHSSLGPACSLCAELGSHGASLCACLVSVAAAFSSAVVIVHL